MNIVADINSLNQFNILKDYVKYIIVEDEYLSSYKYLNLDSVTIIKYANMNNIMPIVRLDSLIHPDKVKIVEERLNFYKDLNCLFLVTDLGVCNIAMRLKLSSRIIYDPKTLITNSLDAKMYSNFGFNALGLSLEITLADIKNIIDKTNIDAFYQVFGYPLMMYSKRKLVSLYYKNQNLDNDLTNLEIEEITRPEKYRIIENENGTFLFRSYLISLIKDIKNINFKYIYLSSFNINLDIYNDIVKIYYDYLNSNITLDKALNKISNYKLNIQDGFSYKDSDYKKEELH